MCGIHPAILISLGICLVLLCYELLERYIGKYLRRGIKGCIFMLGINYVVPATYVIQVNLVTVIMACLTGVPGMCLLYLLKYVENMMKH